MLLALGLGTALGIARRSRIAILRIPANAFVQLIRNIPPLVFVFIFYFFISNQLIPLLGLDQILRQHSGDINVVQNFLFIWQACGKTSCPGFYVLVCCLQRMLPKWCALA